MIDFEKAYPKKGECDVIVTSIKGNIIFNDLVKFFNLAKKTSVSIEALTQNEITGLELLRDNKNPNHSYKTPDGIDLYPLFWHGWQNAIIGNPYTFPDCYKRSPEIKKQIMAGYREKGTPPDYFEYFTVFAYNEVAQGWACAKMYFWLKDGQQQPNEKDPVNQPKPVKTFDQYFASNYKEKLPQALKKAFIGKKGKDIRLMIEVLKAKGIIRFIGTDEELFRVIELYFGGEKSIGSRVGIFQSYQFNPEKAKCKKEFNDISLFIENIIKEFQ